jgi:hypothetical protein
MAEPNFQDNIASGYTNAGTDDPSRSQISGSGIEDQPAGSKNDNLGFRPYVEAVYSFLNNDSTKPPFTLSIEGEWGSGKSSFMLQLEDALKANRKKTVKFNAWRHDKVETMWAAFALHFIKEMAGSLSWYAQIFAQSKIHLRRFDFGKGWLQLLKISALMIFYAFVIFKLSSILKINPIGNLVDKEGKFDEFKLFELLGLTGILLLGVYLLKKIAEIIGNPLEIKLQQYIVTPNYVGNTAFIEAFHRDFEKIVHCMAGKEKKIFVFIDDLDRADIPKAAELMQGLNMMISNSPRLIFIIGMDREKVAAGIAAKYKDLLPYLANDSVSIDTPVSREQAMRFGYHFLEKFVQVSFNIPKASAQAMKNFIFSLGRDPVPNPVNNKPVQYRPILHIKEGDDSAYFQGITNNIAPFFHSNPRRLKQFVNAFRLKAHIASSTGLLGADTASPRLTLPQLGKFIAITLIWPEIVDDLSNDPQLLATLIHTHDDEASLKVWLNNKSFMELLLLGYPNQIDGRYESEYDLSQADLSHLIETSPGASKNNDAEDIKIPKTESSKPFNTPSAASKSSGSRRPSQTTSKAPPRKAIKK